MAPPAAERHGPPEDAAAGPARMDRRADGEAVAPDDERPGKGDTQRDAPAAIVQLASWSDAAPGQPDDRSGAGDAGQGPGPEIDPAARARAFAEPLLSGQLLDTGEPALAHADGVAVVLRAIGAAPALVAASYLVYAGDYLQRPEEVVRKAFGEGEAQLVKLTRELVRIQRAARGAVLEAEDRARQIERVRKMLLAFSRDLRVVLLRLASRLQTLRWHAASKHPCAPALAEESLQVFAPLASRLGIAPIKWELEDLSFRFLQPVEYQRIARLVHETRAAREAGVQAARERLAQRLHAAGIAADVHGRPKHLYSIWKKMRGKQLGFEQVLDTRALRVVVGDAAACYAALAQVHGHWTPIEGEFDDYIARPKPNGYQSLHTVVRDAAGAPLEVQIRTRAMHEAAEHGVAAHWMYKEAGVRGYTGVSVAGELGERIAEARKAVLRELLAWERDLAGEGAAGTGRPVARVAASHSAAAASAFDDRIYVFTPQATIIDLPADGTPLDFAYALHTELGHRCRGARVDGAMVPLNTALRSGQTVELTVAKEGGPSMDWLNSEAGYLRSPRARAKVRAWFNAQAQAQTIARGRELVEKLLQREGRTAIKLDTLAAELGFADADALFAVVGKDEFSLRHIEALLRPAEPPAQADDGVVLQRPRSAGAGAAGALGKGSVLVVGMDSLLTSLARCCRPAPPDAIAGFVTRGRGVAIHRSRCSNLRQMASAAPERIIEVQWAETAGAAPGGTRPALYPLDLLIDAQERPGLLRDVSEMLAKDKVNITAMQTLRGRGAAADGVRLALAVEVADTARLAQVLGRLERVPGVRHARRR